MTQRTPGRRWTTGAIALAAVLFMAAAAAAATAATAAPAAASAAGGRPDGRSQHGREGFSVWFPLVIARFNRAGAQSVPTAAATAVPTDSPTPPPTATDVPTPTATPEICGTLAERVRVSPIDVSPNVVQVSGTRGRTTYPVYLAPLPNNGAKVAWSDVDGAVHVTQVDAQGARVGDDAEVTGSEVRGLVANADGGVTFGVVNGVVLSLVRLDAAGKSMFKKDLVGLQSQTITGSKWVDDWGHEARLVWAEDVYALYSGNTQFFGANGKHQGDLYWFFDKDGNKVTREREGWDWGCSHGLDLRLAHNGTRFGPACLSDSYPSKGFHFNHREKVIRAEPSGDASGNSDGRLGGWVPLKDGFLMSFASPEGRASTDVGVVHVSNDADIGTVHWLTNTPGVKEDGPHLARYGRNTFLASWTADGKHMIAEIKEDGTILDGPVAIDAPIAPKDDMMTMADGDVAWAYAWDDKKLLKTVRVDACGGRGIAPPTAPATRVPPPTATPVGPTVEPTDGPSPTPRPMPTPGPQSCTNVITNGTFEDGTRGWTIAGETGAGFSDRSGGKFAAKLLGRNDVTAELRQKVTVPRDAASAHLVYWWKMTSAEAVTSKSPFDFVNISVDGSTAATSAVEVLSNLAGRDGWRLSAYALPVDRTQMVIFNAGSNKRDATTFLVDDVELWVCANAPAAFPSLAVDPASGAASATFTGTGAGFGPGEAVQHWALEPDTRLRFDLGAAKAADDGSVRAPFQVRATVGEWRWMAAGESGRLPGAAAFRVTGAQ